MTGVSKTSLLIFRVFSRFLALTAKFWQANDHRKIQELAMNQAKTKLFRSRNLKGLVFLSPENYEQTGVSDDIAGKVFRQISTLLEKSSSIFRQHPNAIPAKG